MNIHGHGAPKHCLRAGTRVFWMGASNESKGVGVVGGLERWGGFGMGRRSP